MLLKNLLEPDFIKAKNFYKHIKNDLEFDEQGKWKGNLLDGLFYDVEELIYNSLYPEQIGNLEVRGKFKRTFKAKLHSGTFTNFETIVDEVKQLKEEDKKYKVLIFLYIQGITVQDFLFKSLKIDDIKYEYYGKKKVRGIDEKEVMEQIWFQANSKSTIYLGKIYRILATTEAVSERQVIDKVTYNFELIRAAYNYSESLYSRRIISSYDEPLSKLKEPIAYIVFDGKKGKVYHPIDKRFNPQVKSYYKPLKDGRKKLYERSRRIIQSSSSSEIKQLIVRCFELLNDALDSNSRKSSFLDFYRVCEYATGINIQRKNSEILALISKYSNDEIGIAKGKLLTQIRNNLVHEGKFYNYSDIHVNWIKGFAEAVMDILFWMDSQGFKTEKELELFWEMYSDFRNMKLECRQANNNTEKKILRVLIREIKRQK